MTLPFGQIDCGEVLIAATSGRALAEAARRSGYRPLVADLFGDDDTAAVAAANVVVLGSLERGFALKPLLSALERLAQGRAPVGLVYGSGFEDQPRSLDVLDARFGLIGNPAAIVERVKVPVAFARLCRDLAIPHPDVAMDVVPIRRSGYRNDPGPLAAPMCGSRRRDRRPAVAGMRNAVRPAPPCRRCFWPKGGRAACLGSANNGAPRAPASPFRYGGAVRPAGLGTVIVDAVSEAIEKLVAAIGLRGLNSADLLVREDGFDVIEINPRPGATLDVFHDPARSLFDLHVAASRGALPAVAPDFPGAEAAAVVYADRSISVPAGFVWPEWTADRQPTGRPVATGAPLCTVLAKAADAKAARALVGMRANTISAMTGAS